MVLAEREHVEADAVGELDLRHRLGERPLDMDRPPRRRIALGLDERIDAELHGFESVARYGKPPAVVVGEAAPSRRSCLVDRAAVGLLWPSRT